MVSVVAYDVGRCFGLVVFTSGTSTFSRRDMDSHSIDDIDCVYCVEVVPPHGAIVSRTRRLEKLVGYFGVYDDWIVVCFSDWVVQQLALDHVHCVVGCRHVH